MGKGFKLVLAAVASASILLAGGCSGDELAQLTQERDSVNSQLQQVQGQLSQAQSELTQSQTQLNKTQSDFTAAQAELAAAAKKIAELENQPTGALRYFESVVELSNWLQNDPVSEEPEALTWIDYYTQALRIQQNAARDGYLVSVQYHYCDERLVIEYVACYTIAGNYLVRWYPDTDEVEADPLWGGAKFSP